MFDVRESDPLVLSEKATLPVMYGIISQETCRIFMVKHNFGEKSAADLSAFDLCCRCTLCPIAQDFFVGKFVALSLLFGRERFFVFGGFYVWRRQRKMGSK